MTGKLSRWNVNANNRVTRLCTEQRTKAASIQVQ